MSAPSAFVHETACIDEQVSLGVGTKIWHFTHILSGSVVGENCNIGQNVALPLLWSSGTFAAAVEAAGWGIPAFACSMRLLKKFYEICRLRREPPPDELRAHL